MTSTTTLCVIRGFNGGKCYLHFPLSNRESKHKNIGIVYKQGKIGDRLLCNLDSEDNVSVIKNYGSVNDRIKDIDISCDIVKFGGPDVPKFENITINKNKYTKPFTVLDSLYTFTIDPETTLDYDDAISVCIGESESKIYIHIVDINRLLPLESKDDITALKRVSTLYLPEYNLNMLKDEHANNLFSLVVGRRRYVITIEMVINNNTCSVSKYDIYQSSIIVKDRFNYNDVCDLLPVPIFQYLERFSESKLNILDINIPNKNNINDRPESKTSHKIVESLMVLGNCIVSNHIIGCPQRCHPKLMDVTSLEKVTNNDVVNSFITIKKYSEASYDKDDYGHYGLRLDKYTHFTSPIRRYFDILVHRLLGGISIGNIDHIIQYINSKNEIIKLMYDLYYRWKLFDRLMVGDKFEGYVVKITPAGIQFLIPSIMLDGYIHVSKLMGQRWSFQVDKLISNEIELKVGIKLELVIESIDMIKCEISTTCVKILQ